MILVELGSNFLLKQKIFLFGDKLLPVFQHGFLRSAENVYLHNLLVLLGKILLHIILSGVIVSPNKNSFCFKRKFEPIPTKIMLPKRKRNIHLYINISNYSRPKKGTSPKVSSFTEVKQNINTT